MTRLLHSEPALRVDRARPMRTWVSTVRAAALCGALVALVVAVPAGAAGLKVTKNCDPKSGRVIPVSQLQRPGAFLPGHSELMATPNASCKTAARLLNRTNTQCQRVSTQPAMCGGRFTAFGYRCHFSFDGGGGGTCIASRGRRVTIDVP
jgi:hypothetical protein